VIVMELREVLGRICSALEAAEIHYMLVGSFAAVHHGFLRSTADLDFVIEADPEQLRRLIQELRAKDYHAEIEDALQAWRNRSMFNVMDRVAGWKSDFIFVKPRAFSREEFSRRKQSVLEGVPLFIASPEDIIVSKLEWAKLGKSARQLEDASQLFRMRSESLDRGYIDHWANELGLSTQWNEAKRQSGVQ